MTAPSLLAVFAHPDDESLAAGGVLARHAAGGARTAVVTATWAPGTRRAAELAEAVRILGSGEPRLLGFADARVPESAPGEPRLCDALLDEAVRRLVAHVRDVRPEIVVTHDAYGGLSGHPDHVHTHRVTVVGARKAVRSVPDEQVTTAIDVGPWLDRKIAAVLSHRSEVARGAVPGLIASLPQAARERLLATEWYIRHGLAPAPGPELD
ncbi:PIG-L deacetylase family protein [Streptomyces alboniger]|uniref:GlcNAc-PI de-N-acetylase n=1 Tax=Streptomyces alboniger TaxID=132473 RepID=A0A5J6HTT2_STRAD|nr:PIG-L deacetylase family protein [Streptomyces alboniger]QEV21701.1 hypothetical protein CP975_33030 [Streptomyces alboniger]